MLRQIFNQLSEFRRYKQARHLTMQFYSTWMNYFRTFDFSSVGKLFRTFEMAIISQIQLGNLIRQNICRYLIKAKDFDLDKQFRLMHGYKKITLRQLLGIYIYIYIQVVDELARNQTRSSARNKQLFISTISRFDTIRFIYIISQT